MTLENHGGIVAQFGVDVDFLKRLPRGGHGRKWSTPWRTACEVLFVNGMTPAEIEQHLGGPDRRTIHTWIEAGDWLAKRDAHVQAVARQALAQSGENQADVIQRHLKALRAAQSAAILAIVNKKVEGKTLEGVISAMVTAVREERRILGLTEAPQVAVEDNRIQMFVAQLNVPPENREEVFELLRHKIEIESQLEQLGAPQSPPP